MFPSTFFDTIVENSLLLDFLFFITNNLFAKNYFFTDFPANQSHDFA